jgi:streptomycin 6-kinase
VTLPLSTRARLDALAVEWNVTIGQCLGTPTSLIAYGTRGTEAVVLKVLHREGDEWRSGEMVRAFDGAGVVRAIAHADGAVMLERILPGTSLVDATLDDDDATDILVDVIRRMSPTHIPPRAPTVEDWARGFERYVATGDTRVPPPLVAEARETYVAMCASQRGRRLLHGDLQHSNVLFDGRRGWLAIDPKGVVGEVEYELGAALRNPREMPHLMADATVARARVARYASALGLDPERILRWAFAQAVLSAIWSVEDDGIVAPDDPALLLAYALRPFVVR